MKPRVVILTFLLLAATGCKLGPNYQRPQIAVPDQFRNAPPVSGTSSIADTKWFDLFQDDALKQLVTTALANNFDLRIAAERVLEARAQYGITRAGLFPTVDGQAQFTATRSSSVGSFNFIPAGTNLSTSYTQANLSLNWEIDLWGRIRRLTESARAQYLASEEARNGVTISLISDVMNTYFALREQDLELEIGQHTRDIANDNLRLINLRHDRGAANGLEVHQAEQFLYTAAAEIAGVERSIGQNEDALNLLLGSVPGDVRRGKKLEEIALAPELPAGLPSTLIERRPDLSVETWHGCQQHLRSHGTAISRISPS